MFEEYIKRHPNTGKQILYTEAFSQIWNSINEQIADIEYTIKDTLLSTDSDIKDRLLPSLKRTRNGLKARFEKGGMHIDVKCCAIYILDMEAEQIQDPLACCRYYNGREVSDSSENGNNALFAEYEKKWMEWRVSREQSDYDYMVGMVVEYINAGLMMFEEHDKAPISLKALLYNRYCHWSFSPTSDDFKGFFFVNYCKGSR